MSGSSPNGSITHWTPRNLFRIFTRWREDKKSKQQSKKKEHQRGNKKSKKDNKREKKVIAASSSLDKREIEIEENHAEVEKRKRQKLEDCRASSTELMVLLLPDDMICTIFAFLDVKDLLLGVNLVCKDWNSLISSGRVYQMEQWIYKKNVHKNSKFRSEGRNFFDKKMWSASIDSFTKAIILNPRDHLAYFWRAYALDESCKYGEAVKDFTKSLEFEPDDATAYSNRGATYRDMGETDKAIRDLLKALRLDPNSAPVHNNLGVVYGDMGRYDEALQEYQKALEIDPDHVVALRNRARRFEKLGKIDEAASDFKRVLELDAKDTVAQRFFDTHPDIPNPLSTSTPAK